MPNPRSVYYKDHLIATSGGVIGGQFPFDQYGASTNVDSGIVTDLWDGANATDDLDIWTAPTAARVHAIVSSDVTDAGSVQTLTLTGDPLDTEICTIGAKVYTWQTVLTDVDGNVLIGATASDSIDNFIAAVMLGAGAGTTYATSMTANALGTTATIGAGDTMLVYETGAASAAVTTTDLTNGSWGAGTFVGGTGGRTIRVHGLTAWTTAEVTEDIILQGTSPVNSVNSYVAINKMEVLTKGATKVNAGIIKATAATDSTITAQITAIKGQTQMAVMSVPSTQDIYIEAIYADLITATGASTFQLVVNPEPTAELTQFVAKNAGTLNVGANSAYRPFRPYLTFPGPCIVKLQGVGGAANQSMGGGLQGLLINNE